MSNLIIACLLFITCAYKLIIVGKVNIRPNVAISSFG